MQKSTEFKNNNNNLFKDSLKGNWEFKEKIIMCCAAYEEIKCMKKIAQKMGGKKLKYTVVMYLY